MIQPTAEQSIASTNLNPGVVAHLLEDAFLSIENGEMEAEIASIIRNLRWKRFELLDNDRGMEASSSAKKRSNSSEYSSTKKVSLESSRKKLLNMLSETTKLLKNSLWNVGKLQELLVLLNQLSLLARPAMSVLQRCYGLSGSRKKFI